MRNAQVPPVIHVADVRAYTVQYSLGTKDDGSCLEIWI